MVAQQDRVPRTLMEAMRHFTPDVADAYVARIKWPNGPRCPKCGGDKIGKIASRSRFQCRTSSCRKQFSLTTGTIFEATHLRLDQWVVAIWMIINCRNGVSSCEIARTIGCKQQSAWHLLHRCREIISQNASEKFTGVVEADSTLVGGLVSNMHEDKRIEYGGSGRRLTDTNKSVVHAVKERKSGNVRAEVMPDEKGETLRAMLTANVEPGSGLRTDAWYGYRRLSDTFDHQYVNHLRGEYVRGDVHSNGCENFFNCLRRALKGTYVRPSREHIAAYVDEAVFRFNIRRESEWTRFDTAMRLIVGKRLTYSELTGGATR